MKNIYNTFKLRTNKRQLYNFTTWHEGHTVKYVISGKYLNGLYHSHLTK